MTKVSLVELALVIDCHLGIPLKEVWKAREGVSGRGTCGSCRLGRLDKVLELHTKKYAVVTHDGVGGGLGFHRRLVKRGSRED